GLKRLVHLGAGHGGGSGTGGDQRLVDQLVKAANLGSLEVFDAHERLVPGSEDRLARGEEPGDVAHALLEQLLLEYGGSRRARKILDAGEIGEVIGDRHHVQLGDGVAPLEVHGDRTLDLAAGHGGVVLVGRKSLVGAENLYVHGVVGARLDVGRELVHQLGDMMRRRQLVADPELDRVGGVGRADAGGEQGGGYEGGESLHFVILLGK